jgi:chemotaxis protein methyltransferase CheR
MKKNPSIGEEELSCLRGLLASRTGLRVEDQNMDKLRTVVAARIAAAADGDAEAYCRLLEADTAATGDEWNELVSQLTVGESFFFRDGGLFSLLQHRILPELIAARRSSRQLRIWSAGCSTGEEPYSLAMAVDTVMPDRSGWDILVLGTDVNRRAIEQARAGSYGAYSLRGLKDDLRARYFRQHGRHWVVEDGIRGMVRFDYGNLVADSFPVYSTQLHDMDLIVCRNVFIYFGREAISLVVPKLASTLRVGGYLITGHGELIGQNPGILRTRLFPESVVYQRAAESGETAIRHVPKPPVPIPQLFPPPGEAPEVKPAAPARAQPAAQPPGGPPQALLSQAENLFQAGAYAAAVGKAEEVEKRHPRHFGALYLMAQAHANLGRYDDAQRYARKAIEADRLAFAPFYLLAHVAELQGDIDEAKKLLNKVIYLEPSFVAAYLDLGALHEREGNDAKALTAHRTALALVRKLPPDATLKPYVELTAGEVRAYLEKRVGEHGRPGTK